MTPSLRDEKDTTELYEGRGHCAEDRSASSKPTASQQQARGTSPTARLISLPTTTAIGLLARRELNFLSLPPEHDPIKGIPFQYSQARHRPSAIHESVLSTRIYPHVPLTPLPSDGGEGHGKPFFPGDLLSVRARDHWAEEAEQQWAATVIQQSSLSGSHLGLGAQRSEGPSTMANSQSSNRDGAATSGCEHRSPLDTFSPGEKRAHAHRAASSLPSVSSVSHRNGSSSSAQGNTSRPASAPPAVGTFFTSLVPPQTVSPYQPCTEQDGTLARYGLDCIPPLSIAPRPASRPVSALSRQRMIYQEQIASRPILYRVPTLSYGTDVPPRTIVPHLHNIYVRKVHEPWMSYRRAYDHRDEHTRNRAAVECALARKTEQATSTVLRGGGAVRKKPATSATRKKSQALKKKAEHRSVLSSAQDENDAPLSKLPLKSVDQIPHSQQSSSFQPSELLTRAEKGNSTVCASAESSSACHQSAASISRITTPKRQEDDSACDDTKGQGSSQLTTKQLATEQYCEQRKSKLRVASKEKNGVRKRASLYPRQTFPHGRQASKPPIFQAGDPEFLRPRFQPPRFTGDLYTPAIVRAGKSAGQGAAAGDIGSKEGWCGLCPPADSIKGDGQKTLVGGWLNLRNSSYRYHLIRAHGISPKTFVPYQAPIETVERTVEAEERVAEGSELSGRCHQCSAWITFGLDDATNFYVHASKCHRENPAPLPSQPGSQEVASPVSASTSVAAAPVTTRKALAEKSGNVPRSGSSSSVASNAGTKGKLKRARQVEAEGGSQGVGSSRQTRSETSSHRPRTSRKLI